MLDELNNAPRENLIGSTESSDGAQPNFLVDSTGQCLPTLPNVAETRLCRVNVGLGGVGVPGIMDTGAQRSLLSATTYERVRVRAYHH